MKREQTFTLRFRHWLKANPIPGSSAFELKQTTTKSLPFSAIQEHQIDALLAVASKNGLLYKAPDDSRGVKPFDLFYLKQAFAWIVISYGKRAYVITIDAFLHERDRSTRKSLTSERAEAIATYTINGKH